MMFFYFLKIIFDISTSKRSKKYKPHSILAKKKKNSKFDETQLQTQCQMAHSFAHGLTAGVVEMRCNCRKEDLQCEENQHSLSGYSA
jgi:hypothetical protein